MGLLPEDLKGEKSNTDRNGGVGDVKRRPAIAPEVDFDEVDHVAVIDPVVKIAQGSARIRLSATCNSVLAYRRPPAVNNHSGDGGNCQDGQHRGFQRQT